MRPSLEEIKSPQLDIVPSFLRDYEKAQACKALWMKTGRDGDWESYKAFLSSFYRGIAMQRWEHVENRDSLGKRMKAHWASEKGKIGREAQSAGMRRALADPQKESLRRAKLSKAQTGKRRVYNADGSWNWSSR